RQHAVRTQARFQRVGHRTRLLEDLLLHVVAVFATLHRVGRQLALVHAALDRAAVEAEHLHAIAGDLDDIVLVEMDHLVGDLDQRLRVRAQEVFADAHADQQWRATTGTDHATGLVAADHGDRVGTFQPAYHGQHRLAQGEAAGDTFLDQRRD